MRSSRTRGGAHLSKRSGRLLPKLLAVMSIAAVGIPVVVGTAAAAHDSVEDYFELEDDANLTDEGGNTVDDWESIFPGGPSDADGVPNKSFAVDFVAGASGPDSSYFTPSTKDFQPIDPAAGNTGWACKQVKNATDKNDILNAYSYATTNEHGGTNLYVGGERYSNEGTAYWGVWYFQQEVGCEAEKGSIGFSGLKSPGDVLLLIDFDNGGSQVNMSALAYYPCNYFADAAGDPVLDETSTCDPFTDDGVFFPLTSGQNSTDCGVNLKSEVLCATTNTSPVVPAKWDTEDKDGDNSLDVSEFFEAGFDLSAGFGLDPADEPCISSFLIETRSSSSIDATLKDFAGGELDTCGDIDVLKYHDLNGNGQQDAGEPGLDGWTVFIDDNGNGILDAGETSTVTATDDQGTADPADDTPGVASFTDVKAGTVSICEVNMTDWINSDPGPDATTGAICKSATAVAEDSSTPLVKFGNYQLARITGQKVSDDDKDGVEDTDPGLSGVSITLTRVDDQGNTVYESDGVTPVYQQTVTSATQAEVDADADDLLEEVGDFAFTGLEPGTYRLCEAVPSGYQQTAPALDANDPSIVTCSNSSIGYQFTLQSQDGLGSDIANFDFGFGNTSLHKVIVIVCHEGADEIVKSPVLDANGSPVMDNGSAVYTLDPNSLDVDDPTVAQLCSLETVADGLTHGNYFGGLTVPGSGTDSGHS